MKAFIILSVCLAVASAVDLHLGFPKDDFSNFGRVIGGKEAAPHSAPYIVSLQNTLGSHFCGGSIIGAKYVITAAHCMSSTNIRVVAGLHDRTNTQGAQSRTVSKYINHSSYKGGVGPYDISLLVLTSPFVFGANIQQINLPADNATPSGAVDLFGWGRDNPYGSSLPIKLMTVRKNVLTFNECKTALPSGAPLDATNVCAGVTGQQISACNGDSGGPLVNTNNELIGIVSWGYVPCGEQRLPSVYTRTSAYISWINDQISRNP